MIRNTQKYKQAINSNSTEKLMRTSQKATSYLMHATSGKIFQVHNKCHRHNFIHSTANIAKRNIQP